MKNTFKKNLLAVLCAATVSNLAAYGPQPHAHNNTRQRLTRRHDAFILNDEQAAALRRAFDEQSPFPTQQNRENIFTEDQVVPAENRQEQPTVDSLVALSFALIERIGQTQQTRQNSSSEHRDPTKTSSNKTNHLVER